MSFTRVRTFGLWTALTDILDSELEKFDDQLSNAVDGRHGGTYAPDAQLVVGGSGFKVTGVFQSTGGATIDATTFTGDVFFEELLNVNDKFKVNPANGHLMLNVFTDGSLTVGNDIVITDDLTVGDDATINGDLAVVGGSILTTLIVGDTQLTGKMQLNGTGKIQKRIVALTNANATLGINDGDIIYWPAGLALTADRTLNISATGAENGMEIEISSFDGTPSFVFQVFDQTSGAQLGSYMAGGPTSTKAYFKRLHFYGGRWHLLAQDAIP